MPYELFDLSKLKLQPLSNRVHDLTLESMTNWQPPPYDNPHIDILCDAIIKARKNGSAVILMFGAHMIKQGCTPLMLKLLEKGLVTHFATNGAGSIHDFELAMIGATTESVERYVSEGQFGLWEETGRLNDAVSEGVRDGLGFGESVGRYIAKNNFPYKDSSILAACYKKKVPITVHVGIGCDIVHEHPNCNGADIGTASMTDFLIYARSTQNLEGGVFLNIGSAVIGPEVYLKCLAMARNVAKQEGKKITNFTTAVMDCQPLQTNPNNDGTAIKAPPKTDPHYYFRPWKTILARTVADGGKSYYIQGDHRETFGNLAVKLLEQYKEQ